MNYVKKINTKSWKQIKQIQNAKNMLEVESAINTAIINAFGAQLGLIKCAMNAGYTDLLKIYGAGNYGNNFELCKAMKNHNFDTYKSDAKKYLLGFVPERMKVTNMYQKMVA